MDVLIVFVDIRGFTTWSENTQVFEHSPDFIGDFYDQLLSRFPGHEWFLKTLGDGAVLVRELTTGSPDHDFSRDLESILTSIHAVTADFSVKCGVFARTYGQKTNLSLGWGISRGTVNKIMTPSGSPDYLGPDLNKAARLCDIARPFGVVIDSDDFMDKPSVPDFEFHPQERFIKSLSGPVSVWVTREIALAFHPREELREVPEVHVAGFCVKGSGSSRKVLLSRRNKARRIYPGLYEGCGGQLRQGESFSDGVKRHYRTELGLEVEVYGDINRTYEIRTPGSSLIPGIAFLCSYVSGTPTSNNHDEFVWKTLAEIDSMDEKLFITDVKGEIKEFISRLTETARSE